MPIVDTVLEEFEWTYLLHCFPDVRSLVEPVARIKEKISILNKKRSRDGCVRFKKVQQQESELQSSNPLPITNYEPTIPTSLP